MRRLRRLSETPGEAFDSRPRRVEDARVTPFIDRFLRSDVARAARERGVLRLESALIEPGAARRAGPWLRAQGFARMLVVADTRTWAAAGGAVAEAARAAGMRVDVHLLEDLAGGHAPSADEETAERVESAVRAAPGAALCAVGSGTVTDLVKLAAARVGRRWVSVPTAPSMNGYTSAVVALLAGGVKRTVPAVQCSAVFADIDVLRKAPPPMVAAGFGDLASKPFSGTCWRLAATVNESEVDEGALHVLDEPYAALLDAAEAVGRREGEALRLLADALLVSGCSMTVAGTSAPASGGEHLVSHYWDMLCHAQGRPVRALHGLQVGVGTRMMAHLYGEILALDAEAIAQGGPPADWPASAEARRAEVRRRHPGIAGDILDNVVETALAKYRDPAGVRGALQRLAASWDALRREAAAMPPLGRLERALAAAGVPAWGTELGVPPDEVRHTLVVCRDIRARTTILDVAAWLGMLDRFADHWAAKEREASTHGAHRAPGRPT